MKPYMPVHVRIADDHEIYRSGLRLMLKRQEEVTLVGEAENGKEVIELYTRLKPDVILMDIVMPVQDGISATAYLTKHHPRVNVIALSMFNEDNLVIDMLEAGAKGYLLKNADKNEIMAAIGSVQMHKPYYCKSTTTRLARMIATSPFNPFAKIKKPVFNNRETDIIRLICKEYTNKQMADELCMSSRTVEGYRLKIQEKLEVKGSVGIVIYAITHGIVKPE